MVDVKRKSWTCRGEHARATPVHQCSWCGAPPGVEAKPRKPRYRSLPKAKVTT